MAELLVWPALLAYGEAAVAYAGVLRRPELATRLAIWGVRAGWVAHTALLVAQAAQADGFAWASRGGLLNLFVWVAVGVYLIWGCSPRFRLLGLVVMPVVASLFALAALDGAASAPSSDALVVAHVALIVCGVGGFAVAAALAAIYLWQERRLRSRGAASVLRVAPPPLVTLDLLAARTAAVALAAFAVGIGVGLARGHAVDVAVVSAFAALFAYGAAFVLRTRGWRGRRFAYASLAGFALVAAFGLPLGHLS